MENKIIKVEVKPEDKVRLDNISKKTGLKKSVLYTRALTVGIEGLERIYSTTKEDKDYGKFM